ncbi:MAG: hypothetical protein HC934_09120 [Acaryochloridaceae cyanobacterium SU_2_1]|nr:hypothetical protein [Acaryochloridaceae cyanobacterium SU_2_1]NJM95298.1 hypothetical protein [Acaryochloridaceae cyanobacterium CSU_5_19]
MLRVPGVVADLTTSLTVEEKVAFRRQSIRVMKEQFELATVAAKAQDYAIARDNFFVPGRRIWFMFGGTIKRQSPTLYEPLQSRLNRINTSLGQSRPQQNALMSDLQEVNRLMQQAVTTSDANL